MRQSFIFFCFVYLFSVGQAQVGIGTNSPVTTLDVHAMNHNGELMAGDGVLVPRVNAIGADGDENGQLIYLTTNDPTNGFSQGFHFWEDGVWKPIASGGGGGGGQIFTSSWFVGNVTSNNTTISDITGRIASIAVNPDLSTGGAATYDVILDDNYLAGDLGTDFHIVSELTTRGTDGAIRRDTQTHRAVQRLSSNSFRIVLNNIDPSSARQIGITVSILRTSSADSFEKRGRNRGRFNTLNDLTTMLSMPILNDRAIISTYDPTLSHINGTTVPTNEEEYEVYFDGTQWFYTDWSSSNLIGPDWIEDPAGWVIGSTVAVPPSKATSPDIDLVRYRELGDNYVEVEMRYAAASPAGGAPGGSGGEYLFTLPNGFEFDTTEHPLFTGTGRNSNSIAPAFSLPVKQSNVSEQGAGAGSEIMPIPFNSTQFRGLTFSGSNVNDYMGWRHWEFDEPNSVYYIRFVFRRL